MSRKNIEFKTGDGVTLRGWFYTSSSSDAKGGKLPCLIMSHGFSAVKEMDLDVFAEYFTSRLPLHAVVYDQRGFGESDTLQGQPRYEIIPSVQINDMKDAITYAQTREDVDADRIGIWGSSYSGGHVLWVGAVDRRVKAVLAQAPLVSGWDNFKALIRSDFAPMLNGMFQQDRIDRMRGKTPGTIPVVDEDPMKTSALPTADSFKFFQQYDGGKSNWKNEVTVRSIEALREYEPAAHIHHISPTPLLMTIASQDVLTPSTLALEAYSRALEPKQLHLLPAGHFDAYSGPLFEKNAGYQAEFLKQHLCNAV